MRQAPHGSPSGAATLRSATGRWILALPHEERLPLHFRDLLVSARLAQGRVDLETRADFGPQGALRGQLGLPLPALHPDDKTLSGHLQATFRELGALTLLLPEVSEASGELRLSLEAGGTLAHPLLQLNADLARGRFKMPALGIEPRDIELHARSRDGALHYRGVARSGPGDLTVAGSFTPGRDGRWRLEASLAGERFTLLNTPQYRLLVSPDLNLRLTAQGAFITGVVAVPEGRLRPKDLGGAIRPSGDAVVVSEQAGETQPSFTVTTIVRLELGRRVRFEGYGLKGRVSGQVVIMDYPGQITSAAGELRIEDGRYRAYGQDLNIERGRLVFVGGPVDDPGLDIRATRRVRDVTAGLYLSGNVSQPQLRIFSDPPMSESDALSYLLLGRPPGAGGGDQQALSAAAATLGLRGALLLGKNLGENLGLNIDELALETERDSGEIRLKLGTYLSSRLYVGYGWGLVQQLNTFLIRYQLSEHVTLEAQSSSQAVGGDILFSIER